MCSYANGLAKAEQLGQKLLRIAWTKRPASHKATKDVQPTETSSKVENGSGKELKTLKDFRNLYFKMVAIVLATVLVQKKTLFSCKKENENEFWYTRVLVVDFDSFFFGGGGGHVCFVGFVWGSVSNLTV